MPRLSLSDVESIADPISTEAFEFLIPNLPNIGGINLTSLRIKCQNVNQPGYGNEAFEVPLHSQVRNVRGRKTYPRTLSVNYVEVKDFSTYNIFRAWHEFIVGTDSATSGGDIADYAVTAILRTFNHTGKLINSDSFYNLFIQDIPDIQLTGESSTAYVVPVTFKYDYVRPSDESPVSVNVR